MKHLGSLSVARKGEGLLSISDWPKFNDISIDVDEIKNIENVISFIEDILKKKKFHSIILKWLISKS